MQVPHVLDSFDIPIKAIGADPTVQHSFLPGLDLRVLTRFDYDFVPDKTHFLQLEAPEECANLTVEFLERHGCAWAVGILGSGKWGLERRLTGKEFF